MAAAEADPRRRRSLAGMMARGCALGLLLCVAGEIGNHLFGCNVHVVVPGSIYRCGQPTASDLERLVRACGIRTVINLRGFGDAQPWYREECRGANRLNLALEDVGLSAGHLPPANELRHLIEILDRSEYPVLFHCYRGVDRTGLGCTVALLLRPDFTVAQARKALSLRFLHLPWGRTGNLDRFFDLYEEWLGERGQVHSPDTFRFWAEHDYSGGACRCRIEFIGPVLVGSRAVPLAGALAPGVKPAEAAAEELPPQKLLIPRGQPFALRVRCHNTSVKTWRLHPNSNAGIHLDWMVRDDHDHYLHEGRSGQFRAEVPPGASIDLTVALPALWLPGAYFLLLDMNEEQHCPFRQTGSEPLDLELEVS